MRDLDRFGWFGLVLTLLLSLYISATGAVYVALLGPICLGAGFLAMRRVLLYFAVDNAVRDVFALSWAIATPLVGYGATALAPVLSGAFVALALAAIIDAGGELESGRTGRAHILAAVGMLAVATLGGLHYIAVIGVVGVAANGPLRRYRNELLGFAVLAALVFVGMQFLNSAPIMGIPTLATADTLLSVEHGLLMTVPVLLLVPVGFGFMLYERRIAELAILGSVIVFGCLFVGTTEPLLVGSAAHAQFLAFVVIAAAQGAHNLVQMPYFQAVFRAPIVFGIIFNGAAAAFVGRFEDEDARFIEVVRDRFDDGEVMANAGALVGLDGLLAAAPIGVLVATGIAFAAWRGTAYYPTRRKAFIVATSIGVPVMLCAILGGYELNEKKGAHPLKQIDRHQKKMIRDVKKAKKSMKQVDF